MEVGDIVCVDHTLKYGSYYGGIMCREEHFSNRGKLFEIIKISSTGTYYLKSIYGKICKYTYSEGMLRPTPYNISEIVINSSEIVTNSLKTKEYDREHKQEVDNKNRLQEEDPPFSGEDGGKGNSIYDRRNKIEFRIGSLSHQTRAGNKKESVEKLKKFLSSRHRVYNRNSDGN